MSTPPQPQELQQLQEQVAWLEDTLAGFGRELGDLHARLARLEAQLSVLHALLTAPDPEAPPAAERPPHY